MRNLFLASLLLSVSCSSIQPNATTYQAEYGEITQIAGERFISGVYPHLTTYAHNRENGLYKFGNECGIGAIAIWGGKLYMVNYAAHEPKGSEHNLYVVDENKNVEIYPLSVGGTPAARMIHQESEQLLIGHYLVDKAGNIRTIPIKEMPGRISAIARHIKEPATKVYYYDMEGMLYEVDINSLEVNKLYHNPLPGWHGKGGYTAQGRLVLANNGEHTGGFESQKLWQVSPEGVIGKEKNGVLAEFDGDNFKIVERRQYTDVTTKHGINAVPNDNSPLWSMGWDKRSVRLKVMEDGNWSTYLLPKATYNNDPSHGWFTEWPRIREIGNGEMMMDMHGMFYDFPAEFSSKNSAGIRPIASHIRYIPDFCSWNDKIVLATDESSVQGNLYTGQPQSNLWFGTKDEFKNWGVSSAYGAVWLEDKVQANESSLPYLFAGFDNRMAHITNHSAKEVTIVAEIDKSGDGAWTKLESFTLEPNGYLPYIFSNDTEAEWIRFTSSEDAELTLAMHYTTDRFNNGEEFAKEFAALADVSTKEPILNAKLYSNRANYNMSCYTSVVKDGELKKSGEYEFTKFDFKFAQGIKDTLSKRALHTKVHYSKKHSFAAKDVDDELRHDLFGEDEASVILHTSKGNLRLPKGDARFSSQSGQRVVRELESEREIANFHGTFYELPLSHVGKEPLFEMMRPISSHNKLIDDFNTWNGLLVLSGVKQGAKASNNLYIADDADAALWFGSIDDLWKLGKPVGKGGVWYNSKVEADKLSDPYIMTGYDKKELIVAADKDIEVTIWLVTSHYSDNKVKYSTIKVKAGEETKFAFPKGFSAHWVQLSANNDCIATAQFIYE